MPDQLGACSRARRLSPGLPLGCWSALGVVAALAACTTAGPPDLKNATVAVQFHGYASQLLPTTASLTFVAGGQTLRWDGDHAVGIRESRQLAEVVARPGDSVHAMAVVRAGDGSPLAEVRLARRLEADFYHSITFQVGGLNPDLRGFCHQSPVRAAIVGFPGDTLYLWWAGLPIGAVC